MTIYLTELDSENFRLPSPDQAFDDPNGLLAFGGDLNPKRLLEAYNHGIFPWYGPDDPILWWSPSPRAIIDPLTFKPAKSLKKFQRKHSYCVTMNYATRQVIASCASTRGPEDTWLNPEMQAAYIALADSGQCHSVEVWQDNQLVGGLYGILRGQIFCGESMFSTATNASKIALWYFCRHFAHFGGKLIDCQVMNPHLESLGAIEEPRDRFLEQLHIYKDHTLSVKFTRPQQLEDPDA